jgi:hypothetical protein
MDRHALTQAEVAQIFSVSQPAVYKWLKNTVPDGDTVSQIARYFSMSVEDLLYGRNDTAADQTPKPTEDEAEAMLRRLPPSVMAEVTRRVHRDCLLACDVKLDESAFRRGWVDASLEYKIEGLPPSYPSKVRISRLDAARASEALHVAVGQHDPEAILIPSLPVAFLKAMPSKGDPLRMLTPFCVFALCRAAVRLSFGDAAAPKILRDLTLGYWLDLLEEGDAGK